MKLEKQILAGFAAGILVGSVARIGGLSVLRDSVIALEPVGVAFIRLVSMVVVPLVIASVFVGVASLGDVRSLGRIGGKTLLYFLVTTLAAATIGLLVAMAANVGAGLSPTERAVLNQSSTLTSAPLPTPPTFVQTLISFIPQNPFASAASGDLLPLIIAVCIFGAAATVAPTDARSSVVRFFDGVNTLALIVITWLMKLAPAAVFVLIAVTVAKSGLSLLTQLAAFTAVVVIALAMHVVLVLLPALRIGARLGVTTFARSVSDALLLAFSTASSNATLPVSMAAARERLRIPSEIVGFVLPSGASLNKNGAAVYKAVTAVFLAQIYGLPLTAGTTITIVLTSALAAFAGTGVPGSSLVTTLIVLNAIGLGPRAAAGIALVAAVDRPLDMLRTTVNTIGNLIGAAWIGRAGREA
ncbi:MAG TPA: dicarboxylate/amino acid:cation symporter [Gemmatimonadaceae bacterium]